MHAAETAPALNLKNGNDDDVVVDCSLLDDTVTGIEAGAMDGDSISVGTSNFDDDDIRRRHLAGPSFWV